MADNVPVTAGSGTSIATDDASGVHFQKVKLVDGTADSTAAIPGDATNGLDVDVTRVQGTVAVSAASLPLPTGAATQATLASILSALASVIVTATDLDIRFLDAAGDSVAIGGTVAADIAAIKGHVDTVETALTTLDGRVDGIEAALTTITGHLDGVEAALAAATPAGTNNIGSVAPYAQPADFLAGAPAAITDDTAVDIIAAQAGGVRIYVTHILVTNSHASVSTEVQILDGATVIYRGFARYDGGGFSVALPVPLRGTAATALKAKCATTGANVFVSVSGYKSTT